MILMKLCYIMLACLQLQSEVELWLSLTVDSEDNFDYTEIYSFLLFSGQFNNYFNNL